MRFSALQRFLGNPREGDDVARVFARVFNTEDGRTVLDYLHRHSIFRVIDPQMTEENLRFLEGQRQLVLFICQMAAKGNNTQTTENE